MKKGWRKISCLAIATLAMVFTFATCTINIDSPETNTEQGGETAHEWDNGKITKAATENDDGEKTFTCTKCGETKTEIIPALGHKHTIASEWASDEVLHWHEASCEKEEHRADKAAHEWNAGEIIKAATESDDGEKRFVCATCGKTKTEVIPALNHEHTIASEWTSDEALHWHEASCGKEEHRTDKTAHIWNTGEVTTEPTCTAVGERVYTCTVCGVTKTEPIAATGHE